jgi:anti-sigma-K factor RskA
MTCAEFAERLEDYVTSTLAPDEQREIEAHADLCPACGAQLNSFREATALLWLALPQVEPPARLRGHILAAARATTSPATAPTPVAVTTPGAALQREARPRWRFSLSHLAAAIAALALALTITLGAWMVTLQDELARQVAENVRQRDQIARQRDALYVLMSPALVERSVAGSDAAPQARGRLYLDPTRQQGMLVANDLPRPAPDRAYQVWLRGKDGVVSAGLLRFDDRGTGYAVLSGPRPLDQFEAVGVSPEPAGGSPQPTGPRLMLGSL